METKKVSFIRNFVKKNFGLGLSTCNSISKTLGINVNSKILKQKQLNDLSKKLNTNLIIGKKLKDNTKNSISFLIKAKTYKGLRHKLKYPARGQRTHTNAKTKKKFKY